MALVGEAHIVVRAITTGVKRDIEKAFDGIDTVGRDAGRDVMRGFTDGINSGSRGLSGAFDSLESATSGARKAFDGMLATAYTLGPALTALVGAISAVVSGLVALAAGAAAAAPALIVLPGILAAIGAAGITAMLAFRGVGEAISAGMKAQSKANSSAAKTAKDLTSYTRAVADARRNLARTEEDNADRLAAANKRVADALLNVSRVDEDNARKISDAKKKVQQAQEKLNLAYEDGVEKIQQLNFAAEEAALGEKRAALNLDKARDTLMRTQDLPPNSRARREAELSYAEADLAYRKAKDANQDQAKETAKANATGVEGLKDVVEAHNNVTDALEDQARAEQDAAEARADAVKRVNDAYDNQTKVREQVQRSQEDALRRLKRAEEDLEKARKKGNAAAVTATNAYKDALAALSPEAQDFVKFMVSQFIPKIKELQAAAGKEFFPKLITAMTLIKDKLFPALKPLLTETGGALGDLAEKVARFFTSDDHVKQFEKIWRSSTGVIKDFGDVFINIMDIMGNLLVAARPLLRRFTGWLVDLTQGWADFVDAKKGQPLIDFFGRAGDVAAKLGDIFGSTFGILGALIRANTAEGTGGQMLLNWIRDVADSFNGWANSTDGQKKLTKFFQDAAENTKKIFQSIGPYIKIFFGLGTDPAIGKMADTIKDMAPSVESIADKFMAAAPALADFAQSALDFVDATTDSGAIEAFWGTLKKITDTLADFFRIPAVQNAFVVIGSITAALVAMRVAWGLLKIPLLAVMNPLLQVGKIFGSLFMALAPFMGDFGAFIQLLSTEGLPALGLLSGSFGAILGPVLLVVAAVAAAVAVFVLMWKNSEKFRKAIMDIIDAVKTKFLVLWDRLKEKLDKALEPLGGLQGVLEKIGEVFKWLGDQYATYIAPFIEVSFKVALDAIAAVFGTIIDAIGYAIQGIKDFIDAIKRGDIIGAFKGITDAIMAPFRALGENLVQLFVDIWNDIIDTIKDKLGIASPSTVFIDIAKQIFQGLVNGLTSMLGAVFDALIAPFKKSFEWITKVAIPKVQEIVSQFARAGSKIWDFFLKSLQTTWTTIKTTWGTITGTVSGWVNNFKNSLSGIWGSLLAGLQIAWANVKKWWNANVAGKGFTVPSVGPFGGYDLKIPALAAGGVVPAVPGGILAQLGEGGRRERVEPLDQDGLSQRDRAIIQMLAGSNSGGVQIKMDIHPAPGMDERELAKAINRELAFQLRLGI